MTRRRIIEGTWTCSSCQREGIPGRERRCPQCGSPREADGPESTFDFGPQTETGRSEREAVTEAAQLARAAAGADWFCGYCGAGNAGDAQRCRHCNAPTDPSNRRLVPPGEAVAGGSPSGGEPQEAETAVPPPKARGRRRPVWLLVLLAVGAFLAWGLRTRADTGVVEAVRWTRVVHQERFVPETREGWRDELQLRSPVMPVNGRGEVAGVANLRECHRAQRGTRQVPDGTERVCRTKHRKVQCGTREQCRRRDLGNGFAEEVCEDVPTWCQEAYEECRDETRYRQEPVYGQRCSYDTYVWKRVGSHPLRGGDAPPRWPDVRAGAHERLLREETYAVDIAWGDGKHHILTPATEAEFLSWRPRGRVDLRVNNFGRVTAAAPAP